MSKEQALADLKKNYRAANGARYDDLPKPMQDAILERRLRQDPQPEQTNQPKEINGPKGLEPTRFGDWEKKGIISDF